MLSLEFNIVGGGNNQFNGRKLFSNLNLFNPNPKAVEIANRELATICRAIGVMNIQDSSQLHNKPMVVKVSVSDDGKRNEIDMYASVNGASAAPDYAPPAQSAQTYAPPPPPNPAPTHQQFSSAGQSQAYPTQNTQPPMGEAPPWG
jgi:hypothetical protein